MMEMKMVASYITLGIADLALFFLLFNGQQYFSIVAMLFCFMLAAIAAIAFVAPHRGKNLFLLMFAISIILAAYEFSFDLFSPQSYNLGLRVFALVSAATVISIFGILILESIVGRKKSAKAYAYALLGIIIIAFLSYSIMYIINKAAWNGVDELAYNYYAAYLFVHGQNPYVASMQPILEQRGILPTLQLNGTYEYAYAYPALSFLLFLPIPLLGISSFFSFIAIVIFITIAASYFIYNGSNSNAMVLLPLALWIGATYVFVGVVTPYVAITAFLLIAYALRHRPLAFGVLLGLAASTTQLAWFAIPFFYVLMLKEKGMRASFASIALSILTFIVINAYFIAAHTASLGNIISLIGTSKLPLYGSNFMQFATVFYNLPYWYSYFLSAITYLAMLALYYFYPRTLKAFPAVVPMMVFLLSWRDIVDYALPFIPLLLAIYFLHGKEYNDILNSKKPIFAVLALLVILGVAVAVPLHNSYVEGSRVSITNVMPIINVMQSQGGTAYSLYGLDISVNNTLNNNVTVSFYMQSRSPSIDAYTLGSMLKPARANTITTYQIKFALPLINRNTEVALFLFSENYTTSRIINFTRLR